MEMVPERDLIQYFKGSLFLYRGKPVYCNSVRGNELRILILESQEEHYVVYDPSTCTPIGGRIGNVNHNGGVCYVSRKPSRQFQIGINPNNTSFRTVGSDPTGRVRAAIQGLNKSVIADAIAGKYPNIAQAFHRATVKGGTVAFDRQFAIDFQGVIYYHNKGVGTVDAAIKPINLTTDNVVFLAGNEYLKLIIGGPNGQDYQHFSPR